MKIVENAFLPLGGYKAMTIGPWIFVHYGAVMKDEDVNHEAIHWEQEKELLIVGFYILYVLLFLWELVRCTFDKARGWSERSYRNGLWGRAYRSNAFEREAYAHEREPLYKYQRKRFAWARKWHHQ